MAVLVPQLWLLDQKKAVSRADSRQQLPNNQNPLAMHVIESQAPRLTKRSNVSTRSLMVVAKLKTSPIQILCRLKQFFLISQVLSFRPSLALYSAALLT